MWCIGRCRSRWSVNHPLVLWWSLLLVNIWIVARCLVSCSSCCVGLCGYGLPCCWWWQWRECMCWCVCVCVCVCVVSAVVAWDVVDSWCCTYCLRCCQCSNSGWDCCDAIDFDSDPILDFDSILCFGSILDFNSILDCSCASLPTWLWLLWIRELIEGRNSKIKSRKSLSTELYRHVCMMFVKIHDRSQLLS